MSYRTPRKTPNKRSSVTPSRASTSIPTGRVMNGLPIVPSPRVTPAKSMVNNTKGEEGIQVAIRMRPLHGGEASYRRVWKVLPKYSSVTQTTSEGEPLPERVMGRTFFTYDKTFGEEATTRQVYDNVCKNIVTSVVTGLNGTIFAYGQTSSGKTFTMQGSGTIQEGSVVSSGGGAHTGGIVHMAAADMFDHIRNSPQRIFLVRVSFLEIYNEEVRDLLVVDGANKLLKVREDPRRGVFVESREEIVTDFRSMLAILFQGEKSRAFAATAMNERSSRSHTIFRVTVESRQKKEPTSSLNGEEGDENIDENQAAKDEDDGAVLISTLNLVDLAGSESVRHTGATGDRQKEGGMINQSLLTLSRVMTALGAPNQTHINFRDSKLTRLLQPSLSGNARMSVICCATPSELYLEETRSTLLFAARAKLVKTSARVNEVLDDRSLIKRLQRELAEARRNNVGGAVSEHVQVLQERAESAGTAAREAVDKLRRLQSSILNNGVLFVDPVVRRNDVETKEKGEQRKRRLSEGSLLIHRQAETFLIKAEPKTLPRPTKQHKVENVYHPDATAELSMLRQALVAKSNLVQHVKYDLDASRAQLQGKELQLICADKANKALRMECDSKKEQISQLNIDIDSLRSNFEESMTNHKISLQKKDLEIEAVLEKMEQEVIDRRAIETVVDVLHEEKRALKLELGATHISHKDEIYRISHVFEDKLGVAVSDNQRLSSSLANVQSQMDHVTKENSALQCKVTFLEQELKDKIILLARAGGQRDELLREKSIVELELLDRCSQNKALGESVEKMTQENIDKDNQVSALGSQLAAAGNEITSLKDERTRLDQEILALQVELDTQQNHLEEKTAELKEQARHIEELEGSMSETKLHRDEVLARWESIKSLLEQAHQKINMLQISLEQKEDRLKAQQDELMAASRSNSDLFERLTQSKALAVTLHTTTADLESKAMTLSRALEISSAERDTACAELSKTTETLMSAQSKVEDFELENSRLRASNSALATDMDRLVTEKDELQKIVVSLEMKCSQFEENVSQLSNELRQSKSDILFKSAEVESISKKRDEMEKIIEATTHERDAMVIELTSTIEKLMETKRNVSELDTAISVLQKDHDALINEKENLASMKIELENAVADLTSKSSRQEEEVQELTCERDETNKKLMSTTDELEITKTEMQQLSQTIINMERSHEILSEEMRQATERTASERDALRDELSRTNVELISAQTKVKELGEAISTLEGNRDTLSVETETMAAEKKELETNILDLESMVADMTAAVSKLENEREELNMSILSKSEEMEWTKAEMIKLSEMIKTMEHSNDVSSSEFKKTLEATLNERNALSGELSSTNDKLMEAQKKVAELSDEIAKLQSISDSMSGETKKFLLENEELRLSVDEFEKQSVHFEATLTELSSERDTWKAEHLSQLEQLESAKTEIQMLTGQISNYILDNETLVGDLRRTVEDRATVATKSVELEMRLSQQDAHVHLLQSEIASMTEKLSVLMDDGVRLESEIQTRDAELLESKSMISNLKTIEEKMLSAVNEKTAALQQVSVMDELVQEMTAREQEVTRIGEELRVSNFELNNKISSHIEEIMTMQLTENKLRSSLRELEGFIQEATAQKQVLEDTLNETNVKLSTVSDELINVHDMLETSTSRSNEMKQQISDLQDELESREAMLSQSLTTFEDQRALFSQQLEQERSALAKMKIHNQELIKRVIEIENSSQLSLSQSNDSITIHKLQSEMEELKQLLAASNASIGEARTAAFTSDEELQQKKIQLADANRQLHELRLELQKTVEENRTHGIHSHLVHEMERIVEQKNHLQKLLAMEKESRSHAEAKLKQQSGEEQREIIRQAEVSMQGLRQQIQELEQLRKKSESEAYIAREQSEELRDQHKQSIKKAIQLESEISALRNEVGRLKQLTSRNEPENNRETEKMVIALNKATCERNEVKNMLLAVEERMKKVEREKGEIAAQLNLAHETASRLNVPKLQEENSLLQKENDSLRAHVPSADSRRELESLRLQVDDLLQQIRLKDERIKKLEVTKLKKDQVAALKKMKAEHAEYKERMKQAEKEVGELRRRLHEMTTSTSMEDTETTKLRFDKEALENKLRKYASHCQSLEEEKASIVEVLRSTKLADVDETGLSHVIVNLCDRLASLEEECNSLATAESQASSSLSELNMLRERSTSLQVQLIESRKKLDEVGRVEMELKSKSASLQQELNDLRRELSTAEKSKPAINNIQQQQQQQSDLEEQTRSKVRYLEQENLQLMIDLKSTKKQLQNAKSELSMVRLHLSDERNSTETIIAKATTILKQDTTTSVIYNNNSNSTLSDLNNTDKKKTSIPPSHKTLLAASPLVDKENRRNSSVHNTSSTTNKATTESSNHKKPPVRRQFSGLLGEVLAPNDENTQESHPRSQVKRHKGWEGRLDFLS